MKRAIFAVLWICLSIIAHAQIKLGVTETELRKTIKPPYKIVAYDKGTPETKIGPILTVEKYTGVPHLQYYFFHPKTRICYLQVVMPADPDAEQEYISDLNKLYKVKSANRWQAFKKGKSVLITMEYDESKQKNLFRYEME